MKKVLTVIHSEKWNDIDVQVLLKNPEEWQMLLKKFKFKDCILPKYLTAMKKIIQLAFEESVQKKEEKLKNFR